MQSQCIRIRIGDGRERTCFLAVKIADRPREIRAGYQYLCPEVIQNSAILFDFGSTVTSRFHMRNVYAPLDIAFFNQKGILINTVTMQAEPPGTRRRSILYQAESPYRYALETPAGQLTALEMLPGITRLQLLERCDPRLNECPCGN